MKLLKRIVNRFTVVSFALLVQLFWLIVIPFILTRYYHLFNLIFSLLSMIAVVLIINKHKDPSVKLAWIVPILIFPIFGWSLYLFFGTDYSKNQIAKEARKHPPIISAMLPDSLPIIEKAKKTDPHVALQMNYVAKQGFPVYENTKAQYYPSGELWHADLLEELKKAEKFIFLEFFIIKPGYMWDSILDILRQKAKSGVDVRVIYDDVGSINHLPSKYYRTLESEGIKCISFNRFRPFLSIIMNNRDHRKIAVIDGNVGFTGGANLADEYINQDSRFGYWKDSSVCIKGAAVASLTSLFLEMWNTIRKDASDTEGAHTFLPDRDLSLSTQSDGAIQPFGDTPLDDEQLSESIYLGIINQATEYVYIFTPYLIINNVITDALVLAAKRGVDVRIVIPGIPDKKIVYQISLSHCPVLVKAGVKIYTYTPGFIHSKCFVCDGKIATVGTVNLDYRSLRIHFECGCIFYNSSVIENLYRDTLDTFEVSKLLEIKYKRSGMIKNFYYALLRLFSPLM